MAARLIMVRIGNGLFGGFSIARSDYSGSLSFINDEVHFSATWYIPNFRVYRINLLVLIIQ